MPAWIFRNGRSIIAIFAVLLLLLGTARMHLHPADHDGDGPHTIGAMDHGHDATQSADDDADAAGNVLHAHPCVDLVLDLPLTVVLPVAPRTSRDVPPPTQDERADNVPLAIDLPPVESA